MLRLTVFTFVFLGLFETGCGVDLPTAKVAIVGRFTKGPVDVATEVDAAEFNDRFGSELPQNFPAEAQVRQFFRNGGTSLSVVRVDPLATPGGAISGSFDPSHLRGLGALLPRSDLGLLLCPELSDLNQSDFGKCLAGIEILGKDRPLFTLLDPPASTQTIAEMVAWRGQITDGDLAHAATYFPKIEVDPASWSDGSSGELMTMGASGTGVTESCGKC